MGTITDSYQSVEVTALTAKYLINEYYGSGPDHSYWVGCSTGGRQGMLFSQNFPQYFDGIVAGDAVYDSQAGELSAIWGYEQILNVYQTATPPLTPSTPAYIAEPAPGAPLPLLYPAFPLSDQALFETALLQACDALDGVTDGVIDNLPACRAKFDPSTATYIDYAGMFGPPGTTYPLQCSGAKNATCLLSSQIQAVKNIVQGARTIEEAKIHAPAGAEVADHASDVVWGYPYDGGYFSTVGIPARYFASPTSAGNASTSVEQFPYAFISPPNPSYNALSFNFTTDQGLLSRSTPDVSYSTSLDISEFVNYGHKIIWYHGLSDPEVSVIQTIAYYEEMARQYGGLEAVQKFSRFYPIPNMDHCTGGATTDQFDLLTPLANWVEQGVAPGSIPARGVNFNAMTYQVVGNYITGSFINAPTTRSRPICPYPQEARFAGSTTVINGVPVASNPADLANASNYTCIQAPPDQRRDQ
jgi:feruloyl esterase